MASSATSALKAALNFRRVFFIGQKISDFIFLSSFFRPAQMALGADRLDNDYRTDKGLTAFTNIDFEDFYETR